MTSSRIVRGTKARVFLYVCVVLIIVGVLACYNSTLSQLDNIKKANDVCHKQEAHLTTQLQMISEYKQSLENSLKTEKAENKQLKQTKVDLENRYNEEKSRSEKLMNENKLRLNSLKQQYSLLETQHEDFQEECNKAKKQQLDEINDIQANINELQEELKKEKSAKESIKSQYMQVQMELDNLDREVKGNGELKAADENKINHLEKVNHELKKEIEVLKEKCPADGIRYPQQVINPVASSKAASSKVVNQASTLRNVKPIADTNVGEEPPAQKKAALLPVEGQMQEMRVLGLPNGKGSSSTTSSSAKVSKASLNGARPLRLPTITPSSSKKPFLLENNMQNMVLVPPFRKLPEGVVPVPMGRVSDEGNDLPNEVIDNRYRNKISNEVAPAPPIYPKQEPKPKQEETDKENGAVEELDGALDADMIEGVGFPVGDRNPAAHDKNPVGEKNLDSIKNAEKQNFRKQHIDALGMVMDQRVGDKNKVYDGAQENKEYKEAANDVQLEENDPDEDDDVDDYGDHHHKDPAVRN